MNYIDFTQYQQDDARASLLRRNKAFIETLRRTAERCEETQARYDAAAEGGVVDVLEDAFSWIENEVRSVRFAREKYVEAKQRTETIAHLAWKLHTAELSVDQLVAMKPEGR